MSKVIAISNHKGGVGKTTSAINIGSGLSLLGKRVLLIDLDAQANLTQSLGVELTDELTIYDALTGSRVKPINIKKGLDLIPSTLDLSGAEIELAGEAGKDFLLKEIVEPFRRQYDYIIIDCPPSLGLLTINALTVADEVLIPLQAEYLALRGLNKLLHITGIVQKRTNKKLKVGGVIITQYDSRRILNRDIAESIAQTLKKEYKIDLVFKSRIRDNIALAEAPANGTDIFSYEPKSNGAEDYLALSKEILKKK